MAKETQPSYVERAARFPIRTPMQYRETGDTNWHEGSTVNISHTGVLFDAETKLPLRTDLEMLIVFPKELTGDNPANVKCWGPVVRWDTNAPGASPSRMAASITRYQLGHA